VTFVVADTLRLISVKQTSATLQSSAVHMQLLSCLMCFLLFVCEMFTNSASLCSHCFAYLCGT